MASLLTSVFPSTSPLLHLDSDCSLVPYAPCAPWAPRSGQPTIIGRVSTLKLIDKLDTLTQAVDDDDMRAIPKGNHWADVTEAGTILVIEQPTHQTCAAVGGIMAMRMKVRGLVGCVVGGRVRDLTELSNSGLPVSLSNHCCGRSEWAGDQLAPLSSDDQSVLFLPSPSRAICTLLHST